MVKSPSIKEYVVIKIATVFCNLWFIRRRSDLRWCETWLLSLKETRRFRMIDNGVLRKVLSATGEEGTGSWKKLRYAGLHVCSLL
jgi:hypothetical protein